MDEARRPSTGAPARSSGGRPRLNRERVLAAAVALADAGAEVSMRRLAEELGVVPMALYKHVANKDELLDGMVEVLVGEIEGTVRASAAPGTTDWRAALRHRVLAARSVLRRHRWARQVLESRPRPTTAVLAYTDATIELFLAGGFSADLTHHVMHALGSRMWGFTQELFDDPGRGGGTAAEPASPADPAALAALAAAFPHVAAIALTATHEDGSVVGRGCDDQAEFEFALDLLLDGFARLHAQGWTSAGPRRLTRHSR